MASEEDKLLSLIEEISAKHGKKKDDDEKFVEFMSAMLSLLPKPGEKPERLAQLIPKLMTKFSELAAEEKEAKKLKPAEIEFLIRFQENFVRSMEILQKGNSLEVTSLGVWMWYGCNLYGVELDDIIQCTRVMISLQEEAMVKNETLVTDVTRKYVRDLLSSPRPAPEIPRGFSGAEFARFLTPKFEKVIESGEIDWSLIIKDMLPIMKSYAKSLISRESLRQQIPKVLNGYKDLIEGDFRRLLNWLIALIRIVNDKEFKYEEIKRKSIPTKVNEVMGSSCAILVDCYDRHLRNSIAHTNYSFNIRRQTIEFRDRDWRKKMSLAEFMQLFSKTAAISELNLLFIDAKDKELMKKLSKHRDPGWWERVKSKNKLHN